MAGGRNVHNAAYPVAIDKLKADETIAEETQLRQIKYLNNVIEEERQKAAGAEGRREE